MEVSHYIRRSFFFLIGFAATSAVLLVSFKANAEKMSELGGPVATPAKCTQLVSNIQNNDAPTLLSPEDNIAFNLIQVLYPNIFEVDGPATQEIAVKTIEKLVFQAQQPMHKGSQNKVEDHFGAPLQDHIRLGFWGTPEEFWKKFGLHEAYISRFASDKQFFSSALSLVQIYKNLMNEAHKKNLYGFLKSRNMGSEAEFIDSAHQSGKILLLNRSELKHVANGMTLWRTTGQRMWMGSDAATAELDKYPAAERIWGIRLTENLDKVTNWEFKKVQSVEEYDKQNSVVRDAVSKQVDLLQAADISKISGKHVAAVNATLNSMKRQGLIFSVNQDGVDRFPEFQFSDLKTLTPKAGLTQVLAKVPKAAQGWPLLSWMVARNILLKNQMPYELLVSDTEAVVDAADRFYGQDD